jgi:hypothetical protein
MHFDLLEWRIFRDLYKWDIRFCLEAVETALGNFGLRKDEAYPSSFENGKMRSVSCLSISTKNFRQTNRMVVHTFLDSCLPSYDLDPGTSSCLCALNS